MVTTGDPIKRPNVDKPSSDAGQDAPDKEVPPERPDPVDEALIESFPASDPPGWTL